MGAAGLRAGIMACDYARMMGSGPAMAAASKSTDSRRHKGLGKKGSLRAGKLADGAVTRRYYMTVFSSSSDDCNVLVHVRLMDSEFRGTCPHHSPVILVLSLRVFRCQHVSFLHGCTTVSLQHQLCSMHTDVVC